jgi:hypothetical protein
MMSADAIVSGQYPKNVTVHRLAVWEKDKNAKHL